MERIFRKKLEKKLQRRIKGNISVHVIGDILIIDIQSAGLPPWHYTINNIAVQMSTGLSSTIVTDVIVKQYKKDILSMYFYTK